MVVPEQHMSGPNCGENSSIEPTTDEFPLNAPVGRRQAMRIGAGAAVATVGLGSSMPVSAASGLDFDSGLVQRPRITGSVTVATHEEDFEALDYVDDNGNHVSLRDLGAVIAPREDEDTPHNPISLRADRFLVDEYTAFPRGVTEEDADGNEVDVSALDASHWATDASGTAGSLTVEDDGDALRVAASGQASGDVAIATFAHSDFAIDSGEARKFLQTVLDIVELGSATIVDVIVRDSSGTEVTTTIDTDADPDADATIATSTATGHVYQQQLGDLANGSSLETIEEVEIQIADGDADFTLNGLNLDRESAWSFGTEEYLNADDELDTRDVEEPSGSFSIVELASMDDVLRSGPIEDVSYEIELQASELPGATVDYEFVDTSDVYDRPRRFRGLFAFDVETAYDLSWSLGDLVDDVLFPSGRYVEVGFAAGESEVPTLDDVDDDSVSLTDRTNTYKDASIEDEVVLSSSISSGSVTAVYVDVTVSEDEEDSIVSSGAVGAGAAQSDGWFSGVKGTMMMIGAAVAGMAAWFRRAT